MRSEKNSPAFSPAAAAWLSVAFTLIYVVPFYLSKTTRPTPHLSRDAPSVIRARMQAVICSCVVSISTTVYVLREYANADSSEVLRLLGCWPIAIGDIARSNMLVAVLFAGPLYESGIVEGAWRQWITGQGLSKALSSSIGFRNFVLGPLTEEIVFRSLLLPLHLLANVAPSKIVFVTPLYFGIAHVHHLYEFMLTHPSTPFIPALLRSLFQFTYTSLFGFFAAFLFLRTGSLPAAVLAHSFCNWQGLPRVWGRVEAGVPIGPPDVDRKEDAKGHVPDGNTSRIEVARGRLGIGWTVAYYILFIAGAVGFWRLLWPLTESPRALADFSA